MQTKHSFIYIHKVLLSNTTSEKEIQDRSWSCAGLSSPTGNLTWAQSSRLGWVSVKVEGFNTVRPLTNTLAPLHVPSPAIFLGRMWAAKSQMKIALANPVIQIFPLRSWCRHSCGEHLSGVIYCRHFCMKNRLRQMWWRTADVYIRPAWLDPSWELFITSGTFSK